MEGDLSRKTIEYDNNGYVIRETRYEGLSDVVRSYEEYERDSEGKKVKETTYDKEGNITVVCIYEYEYNVDGSLNTMKYSYYDTDGRLMYYMLEVCEDGRRVQVQLYDSDGKLTSYKEDVFDDEGNHIGVRSYDADGVLQYEHVY